MLNVKKIAFIGGGNMAAAIIRGLVNGDAGVGICVAEIQPKRREQLSAMFPRVRIIENAAEAAAWAEVVILAVKPQHASSVMDSIEQAVDAGKLVVSIMAGIRCSTIEDHLQHGCRVVRAMPNTPALVGSGATAICGGRKASQSDLDLAEQLFAMTGYAVKVEERLMDAVTALSGSGPAFVCMFIEALSDAGLKNGLPREIATKLAVNTVLGTARMVHETGDHPAILREQVTSPGGTTIAGLHALEIGAFKGAIMNAVDAAAERSQALSGVRQA